MLSLALHVGRAFVRHPAVVHEARLLTRLLVMATTRLVAGALHMPDTVVRDTGAFVVAYVAAVEQRATLACPRKVMREVRRRRQEIKKRLDE